MNTEPKDYFAFLLRLWPEGAGTDGAARWRAVLENAHTGERLGFASLEQLFAHLMQLAENRGKTQAEESDRPPTSLA